VAVGVIALTRYQMSPGQSARAASVWPAQSSIARATDRPTLVMFLHPYCPCSRASIEELNRAMAQCPGKFATRIVFFKPSNQPMQWANTDLWRSAEAIPGASVIVDEALPQANMPSLVEHFGAFTSGQVFLYGTRGDLLFSGGITGSRGHAGDNDGLDRLIALVGGEPISIAAAAKTPVFGCALNDSATGPVSSVGTEGGLP